MKRFRGQNGMTLVEVMVAAAILSMVGAALVAILVQSMGGWSRTASSDAATSQATIALQKMLNDVRDGKTASTSYGVLVVSFPLALQDPGTGEVVYDASTTDPVTRRYYVSGGNLVRTVGTTTSVIGRGVNSALFVANGGTVTCTLESSEQVGKCASTQEVTGRVTLRNFRH